jgi:cyclic pyranopterin phosphate synthase
MREDNLVDCVSILRDGASQSELTEVFMKAVALREPYWRE